MKSIKRHLRRLSEEKLIIAKEDGEGGAAAGGDGGVVSPSSGDGGASDIVSPTPQEPPKTGLVTTDVLGNCDHKKDGVFGPGCFHLPCVWTIPSFRYPRKKRKRKLKYSNVVSEEDGYQLFEREVKSVIEAEIESAQKKLQEIDPGIRVVYDQDYEFEGERADWVAALVEDGRDDVRKFVVAFNLRALYAFLFENGLEMDDTEIQLQIRISLWHEIGHALLDYFRDLEIYDFEISGIEEEKLVEEFAKYQIRRYSGVFKSRLQDFIDEMFLQNTEKPDETEVTETKGDVLTDFQQPINLSNPKRFISKKDHELLSKKFIVSDMFVPGDVNLFAGQNGKDVYASLNQHGILRLQVEAEPMDSDEEDYLKLPPEDRKRFVDILMNIDKYLADPKDDFELEVAAEFENNTEEDRFSLAKHYSSISDGFRTAWYRPTLADIIRICAIAGVNQLPLQVLGILDEHDHAYKKRYIESEKVVAESLRNHDFMKEMFAFQKQTGHIAPQRWDFLVGDYSTNYDLGSQMYVVLVQKRNGVGTNHIFSTGVMFGYDESDTRLQTVYYIEPCEVVYMLEKGNVIHGDPKNVSMRLLNRCLRNITLKKAFAGHFDRRKGY